MATYLNGKEEVSPFQFPAGLRVVAVDHDPNILDLIMKMCFRCRYHGVTFSDPSQALNYVLKKTHCIDVILMEVHIPFIDTYELLQHVTKETNIPVIMMSLDDATDTVIKSLTHGACDYWLKPLHENQFKVVWAHVAKKFLNLSESMQQPKTQEDEYSKLFGASFATIVVKPLTWSQEMHEDFVKAVMQIGIENAQPKIIHAAMNVPGLTREHVQTHWQEYKSELLKKSKGVALQQNEKALPNSIESRHIAGHDTFTSYAALPDWTIL